MGFPVLCVRSSADLPSSQSQNLNTRRRTVRRLLCAILLLCASAALHAQQYTKIVIFGDSLSDTGNDALVFESTYGFPFPSPIADYTLGHFTDGPDTLPAAQNYFGVWLEQLSDVLPAHPAVMPSLLGGTNFAYGYANTYNGTTLFNLTGTPYTVPVENVGAQIDEYLATHPQIDSHTLFVVWAGANNITEASSFAQVAEGARAQVENIQRLIAAGATQLLVPNLPDLGSTPRFNTSPTTSVPYNDASVLYNATLDAGVSLLPLVNFNKHLTIYKLDVYSLLKQIIASPAQYGLLNVTDSSQKLPVDPDTYLFWDDIHPTTRGHNLLGQAALKLIEPYGCLVPIAPGEYAGKSAPGCR